MLKTAQSIPQHAGDYTPGAYTALTILIASSGFQALDLEGKKEVLKSIRYLIDSKAPALDLGSRELLIAYLLERLKGGSLRGFSDQFKDKLIPSVSILYHLAGKSQGFLHVGGETTEKLLAGDPRQAERANLANLNRDLVVKHTQIKRSGPSEDNFELNPYPSTYFIFTLLLKAWETLGILDPTQGYHVSIDTPSLENEGLRRFIPSFFVGWPKEGTLKIPILSTHEPGVMGFPGLGQLDEGYTLNPPTAQP